MASATGTVRLWNGPLPEVPMVCIQSFGADVFAERIPQPGLAGGQRASAEFLRDVLQVEIEVVGQERADFGVLVVADERPGVLRGGGVDVDIDRWRKLALTGQLEEGRKYLNDHAWTIRSAPFG